MKQFGKQHKTYEYPCHGRKKRIACEHSGSRPAGGQIIYPVSGGAAKNSAGESQEPDGHILFLFLGIDNLFNSAILQETSASFFARVHFFT